MKSKVYLDLNIFSEIYNNERLYEFIMERKNKYGFFYSPAHIEEIFKALEEAKLKKRIDLWT